jgi:hypothetical protein
MGRKLSCSIAVTCAGGAAGLTLTEADTLFLMEPALNPGLESQAKARIYRLGEFFSLSPRFSIDCPSAGPAV